MFVWIQTQFTIILIIFAIIVYINLNMLKPFGTRVMLCTSMNSMMKL